MTTKHQTLGVSHSSSDGSGTGWPSWVAPLICHTTHAELMSDLGRYSEACVENDREPLPAQQEEPSDRLLMSATGADVGVDVLSWSEPHQVSLSLPPAQAWAQGLGRF